MAFANLGAHYPLDTILSSLPDTLVFKLHKTNVNQQERESYWGFVRGDTSLRASDVTTLVSATLVAIRLAGQTIMVTTVWRCAMILLQHDGLNLSQLDTMITYRVPTTLSSKHAWPITLVLLMMIPSIFIAPLASGSVDWVASVRYNSSTILGGFGSDHRKLAVDWDNFKRGVLPKMEVLFNALGYVTLAWFDHSPDKDDWGKSRYVAKEGALIDTIVENVPMPHIEINSVTWDNVWEPWAEELIFDNSPIRYTGLSREQSYIQSYILGNAVLFDNHTAFPQNQSRTAGVLSLTKKIGVIVGRNTEITGKTCVQTAKDVGWYDITGLTVKPMYDGSNCWALGTVKFTAGIMYHQKAKYISEQAVEAITDPISESGEIIGDTWAEYSVYMLSDMMSTLPGVRRSALATGNLTRYAESLIRHSYVAMRSALFPYTPNPPQLNVRIPVSYLEARVDPVRVFAWLVLNLMLPAAGIILLWIESTSAANMRMRNTILNTSLTPLLTDVREVLEKDEKGISNMSYITKKDEEELGTLQLKVIDTKDTGPIFALKPRYNLRS